MTATLGRRLSGKSARPTANCTTADAAEDRLTRPGKLRNLHSRGFLMDFAMHRFIRPLAFVVAAVAALEGALLHLAHHGHCHAGHAVHHQTGCDHDHGHARHESEHGIRADSPETAAEDGLCLACRYLSQRACCVDVPADQQTSTIVLLLDPPSQPAYQDQYWLPDRARAPPRSV